MGFNIGVSSRQIDRYECDQFIDRIFYKFINEGETYGENSILIQSGRYYGLDLSPLLKLVYTWDDLTDDYIDKNTQSIDLLLDLLTNLKSKITDDKYVCDKIDYTCYDFYPPMTESEIADLIKVVGKEHTNYILDKGKDKELKTIENPNPWKIYFEGGQILNHLDILIKILRCYRDKGVTEIYLTAG